MACSSPVSTKQDPRVMLREAVLSVTTDTGFKLPSSQAKSALECAQKLLTWMPEHEAATALFANKLVDLLCGCIHTSAKSMRVCRERMWGNFYQLCSSDSYKEVWGEFCEDSISERPSPIFYQFIADSIMNKCIKERYGSESASHKTEVPTPLDYNERNALRFTVGSLMKAVKRKLEKSIHPLKDSLLLCVGDIVEDGGYENIQVDCDADEWTDLSSRGGLLHVSDTFFNFFLVVEMAYRCVYNEHERERSKVIERLASDEEVDFYWMMVAVNWEKEEADALLLILLQEWFILRGFSHAGGFLELYKKKTHKSVQKSKGIRKNLMSSKSEKHEATSSFAL